MTTTGLAHFIVDNLLDKVGLNPTWEKVRRYLYGVSVGISLFTLYFTLKIDVECAPAYNNGTVVDSETRSMHVNEYCRDSRSLWLTRYCGCFLVSLNIVILGTAPCWLYMPKIIDSFRTFGKIQKLFDDIHSSYQGIRNMPSTFLEPTNKIKTQLRQLIRLLFKLQETSRYTTSKYRCYTASKCSCYTDSICNCCNYCFDKSGYYVCRCTLLLLIFSGSASVSIWFGVQIYQIGDVYSCTYDLKAENVHYICTTDVALRIAFFNLACGAVYILQMLPTGWGIWKAINAVKSTYGDGIEYPVMGLILIFWRSSTSSNSGLLRECIEEFVFSGRFYKAIVENGGGPDTERAVNKNVDGPDTKRSVTKNEDTPDTDLTKLARFMEKSFSPLSVLTYKYRKYNAERFRNFIRNSEYKLKECFWLAELLVKHELWETFVILMEGAVDLASVKESDETMKRFKSLNVNFDSLASSDTEVERLYDDFYDKKTVKYSNDTHSLLYYAIDNKAIGTVRHMKNLNVAIFLLSCFKPPKPYVHDRSSNQLKSEPAKDYLKSLSSPSTTAAAATAAVAVAAAAAAPAVAEAAAAAGASQELMSRIDECDRQSIENFRCQKVLREVLETYNQKKLRTAFPEIVARRKFRKWDETAVKFFELAVENKDHKIKKALLRAYFAGSPLTDLGEEGSIPSDECINEMIEGLKGTYVFNDCIKLLEYLLENMKKLDMQKEKLDMDKKELDTEMKKLDTEKKRLDMEKNKLDTEMKKLDTEKKKLDTEKKKLDMEKKKLDTEKKKLDICDTCVNLLNKANLKDFVLPENWQDRLNQVNIKYNMENKEKPFRLENNQNTDNVQGETSF